MHALKTHEAETDSSGRTDEGEEIRKTPKQVIVKLLTPQVLVVSVRREVTYQLLNLERLIAIPPREQI